MNPRRLKAMIKKEFLHVLRDWRSLFLALAIPMILIMLFGYALNLDLKNVPTVVWDRSRTPQSRELLSLFDGSPYFSIVDYLDTYRAVQETLEKGRAIIAIVIPSDFADNVLGGGKTRVQVIADGSDANTSRLALGYVRGIGMLYAGKIQVEQARFRGLPEPAPPVEMEPRAWYNPDLRSQNVLIPGIIAIVMIVIAAMLTSVTVAREWEMGTMEQLISTPLRGPELIFGKITPYFAIGLADVATAVLVGQWFFGVPLRGSTALVFLVSTVFLTGALFFGMMLSVSLKKQVLANQAALLAGFLPTMLLSGFVFAIENMPFPIQCLTYIVPARYFISLLRGIYLKGIGLEILWFNALLLAIYALFMVVLSIKRMKMKLE
ncbi:MAG: ABC transporter permease [Deltaproteobacteria bacterium]|nr:ABC transporter permease [Deltaproteobacteria bacterium]